MAPNQVKEMVKSHFGFYRIRTELTSTLLAALAEKDMAVKGHILRLVELCRKIALLADLPLHQIDNLILLAEMHDLGKVAIPDKILFKPGPLNDEEWAIMRQHSEIGCRIVQTSSTLCDTADLVLKHHEKWDGSGYPSGIKGTEIPFECRILAVADAYDVITHERPYKKAMSKEYALQEIKRCSGHQFDPYVVDVFMEIVKCDK